MKQNMKIMNLKRISQILFLLSIIVTANSCLGILCVDGNGNAVTEERIVSGFTSLSNETSANVYIETGDEFSIFVEADENLQQFISTKLSSGVLEIEVKGTTCIRPEVQPVIYITAPFMEAVYLTGSGDILIDSLISGDVEIVNTGSGNIIAEYIEAEVLDIKVSGSGDVNTSESYTDEVKIKLTSSGDISIYGETNFVDFTTTGSGQIYGKNLYCSIADVRITGSGNTHITVSDELSVVLTGSGNLYYYGNPSLSKTISGSGNLIHLNK